MSPGKRSAPAGADRPNIVFIVADQLNTRHLGCYPATPGEAGATGRVHGNSGVHAPVLDALASRGAAFDHAFCQSPLCMPSRASFNTGRFPHSVRVLHNPVDLAPEFPTLAEILRDSGYRTGGFGHIGGDGADRGFEGKVDLVDPPLRDAYLGEQRYLRGLGSDHAAGFCGTHPHAEADLLDDRSTALACRWLEETTGPFYLQLDFMNPHIPLLAPGRFVSRYHEDDIELPPSWRDDLADKPSNVEGTRRATRTGAYDEAQMRRSILHYRALVSYVDELTGRVLETLDRIGASDDTIVCFFADHGDYAGEFGLIGKTGNFYDCLTNVPLIVAGPGAGAAGTRPAAPVGLVDLVPTMLGLVGLPVAPGIEGRSLVSMLSGSADRDAELPAGRVTGRYAFCETRGHVAPAAPVVPTNSVWPEDRMRPLPTDPYSSGPVSHVYDGMMVRSDRFKLSLYGDGFTELYDLEADPWERSNLAGDDAHARIEAELLGVLARWQMECWAEETPQRPLPYHYRATSAEFIPEQFREAHRRWRPEGD